jgi:DNA-binding MarR family transcriptional regulator
VSTDVASAQHLGTAVEDVDIKPPALQGSGIREMVQAVRDLERSFSDVLGRQLRWVQLNITEYLFLEACAACPGSGPTPLARDIGLSPSFAANIALKLARAGLLDRPDDGRLTRLTVTGTGQRVLTDAHALLEPIERSLSALLGEPVAQFLQRVTPGPGPARPASGTLGPDSLLSELGLSERAHNALNRLGIHTVGALTAHSTAQLRDARGIGAVIFREVTGALAVNGLHTTAPRTNGIGPGVFRDVVDVLTAHGARSTNPPDST